MYLFDDVLRSEMYFSRGVVSFVETFLLLFIIYLACPRSLTAGTCQVTLGYLIKIPGRDRVVSELNRVT